MEKIAGVTRDAREAVREFERPDEDISPAVRASQLSFAEDWYWADRAAA